MEGSEQVRCVVVTRPETHGKQSCTYPLTAFSARDEFDGAEEGESVVLTVKNMSLAELEALPEFEGW